MKITVAVASSEDRVSHSLVRSWSLALLGPGVKAEVGIRGKGRGRVRGKGWSRDRGSSKVRLWSITGL